MSNQTRWMGRGRSGWTFALGVVSSSAAAACGAGGDGSASGVSASTQLAELSGEEAQSVCEHWASGGRELECAALGRLGGMMTPAEDEPPRFDDEGCMRSLRGCQLEGDAVVRRLASRCALPEALERLAACPVDVGDIERCARDWHAASAEIAAAYSCANEPDDLAADDLLVPNAPASCVALEAACAGIVATLVGVRGDERDTEGGADGGFGGGFGGSGGDGGHDGGDAPGGHDDPANDPSPSWALDRAAWSDTPEDVPIDVCAPGTLALRATLDGVTFGGVFFTAQHSLSTQSGQPVLTAPIGHSGYFVAPLVEEPVVGRAIEIIHVQLQLPVGAPVDALLYLGTRGSLRQDGERRGTFSFTRLSRTAIGASDSGTPVVGNVRGCWHE